ncbi:MAG: InlB B-repeat-containing protein, partial [Lachnospiraceae bacterium]|nr:InlB B-repeat-containing protein [Lachnospiraceae bacterium]
MKNKLFSKLIVLALAATALMSFSCKQSLDYNKVAGADAGNGSKVKVSFALSFGRTALPEIESRLDDFTFVLKGALTGETQSSLSPEGGWSGKTAAEAASVELEEGHYDFTLTAEYNGLAYIGELSDVSVSGATQTLPFLMYILDPTGNSTGSFSVDLAYPAAEASKVGKITASLYRLTVENDDDVETLVENCGNMALTAPVDGTDALENFKVAPLTKEDLECGHYVLKYTLFADAAGSVKLNRTPFEEDIILGGGINSSSLVKLTVLPDVYTVSYDLGSGTTEGSWASGYTAPAVYTRITKPDIPDDDNLVKPVNYHFSGWYENADFSGSAVTSLSSLYKNITLHAHWMPDSTRSTVAITVDSNPNIQIVGKAQADGNVTFTAEDGCTNYRWYINNDVSGVQGTERIFVLSTANLLEDYYTVTVRAEKGG